MIGIKEILKRSWDIVNNEESSEKAKGNALNVILQCYSFKRQLLIDVTYIQNEINAFLQHSFEAVEHVTGRKLVSFTLFAKYYAEGI